MSARTMIKHPGDVGTAQFSLYSLLTYTNVHTMNVHDDDDDNDTHTHNIQMTIPLSIFMSI